jgi:cytochrome c oxidase assembly factor CtaG
VLASPSPLTSWTFDPMPLIFLAAAVYGYVRRVRTLAARGTPVPLIRQLLFALGSLLVLIAVASPIHAFGEQQFFAAHMLQHVLLGDLAPLAMVAGLTGPILRPVLALPSVMRLRFLLHPLVSLPIWALNLALWHIPFFYDAAVRHWPVHALEHAMFFTCGALMWATVLEVLPAPEWFGTGFKLGYIVIVRAFDTILGNVFLWSGGIFYGVYNHAPRWGISPHADQGIAGGIMMIEGSIVTLAALAWLFLRLAQEGELRQQLLEQGVDPRAAARAVRYGRGHELSQLPGPR